MTPLIIHLENLVTWVGFVVGAAVVLGWIWFLVDTFLTYAVGAEVVTPRAAGPSTARKPVHSNLVTFRNRSIH